jgi:hypothetical protein
MVLRLPAVGVRDRDGRGLLAAFSSRGHVNDSDETLDDRSTHLETSR